MYPAVTSSLLYINVRVNSKLLQHPQLESLHLQFFWSGCQEKITPKPQHKDPTSRKTCSDSTTCFCNTHLYRPASHWDRQLDPFSDVSSQPVPLSSHVLPRPSPTVWSSHRVMSGCVEAASNTTNPAVPLSGHLASVPRP